MEIVRESQQKQAKEKKMKTKEIRRSVMEAHYSSKCEEEKMFGI